SFKEILDNFCDLSGHCDEAVGSEISSLLSFQKRIISTRTWAFLFFMKRSPIVLLDLWWIMFETLMIPKGVCDEIERLVKQFIWGPLMQLIPSHANLDPDYMLDEMVKVDGLWNLDLFRVWLSEDIVRCIENFKRTIDESWKTVWKFQGPQRQRLLTNIKRVGRGIVQDPSYPICAHASGDLYVFRDCSTAKEVQSLSGICVFLHTDGVMNVSTRYASASVVQDHFSDWIVGFNYNLGVCSVFDAEL
ncbi:hypothetical protein Gohar_013509, partial [Gossypium harknessii]|nr:hypothetical protein [Gossypium harknessii]